MLDPEVLWQTGSVPVMLCETVECASCELLEVDLEDSGWQNAAREVLDSYDVVAVQPTSERTFQQACSILQVHSRKLMQTELSVTVQDRS